MYQCRFCGRVLNDGEVCGCQGQSAQQGYSQPQAQRPMPQQAQQRVARPQTQQQVHQQTQTQAQTQAQRQMTPQAQSQNFTQQPEQGWEVPFGGYQQDEGDLFDSPQQDWNIPFKSPEQGWGAPQQDNRGYVEQPFGQPMEQPFGQNNQWGTHPETQFNSFQQGNSQLGFDSTPFQSEQPQPQFNQPFGQPVKATKETDELRKSAKGVLSYFSNMGETLKQAKESKGFLLPLIFSAMFIFVVIATTILPKFISYGIEFNIFRTLVAAVVEAVLPVVLYILAKFTITKVFSKSVSVKDAFLGSVITFGYHALPSAGVLLLNGILSLIFPSISMVLKMLVFCYLAVTLIGDSRDGEPALTDKFSNVLIATLFLTAFLVVLYYASARLDSWSYSSSLSSLFNELFD